MCALADRADAAWRVRLLLQSTGSETWRAGWNAGLGSPDVLPDLVIVSSWNRSSLRRIGRRWWNSHYVVSGSAFVSGWRTPTAPKAS